MGECFSQLFLSDELLELRHDLFRLKTECTTRLDDVDKHISALGNSTNLAVTECGTVAKQVSVMKTQVRELQLQFRIVDTKTATNYNSIHEQIRRTSTQNPL
jgi:hypothetical protein